VIDIDKKAGTAKISCINCGLKRTMKIREEEEQVDVYARFYDSFTEGTNGNNK
jgi:transcription elongation factor Elf1